MLGRFRGFALVLAVLTHPIGASDLSQTQRGLSQGSGTVRVGDWEVAWSNDGIRAKDVTTGKPVGICSSKREEWAAAKHQRPGYYEERCSILSIVGPIVSYSFSYDGSGGAHPIYGTSVKAVNLTNQGGPANVVDLFAADLLLKELLKLRVIQDHLKWHDVGAFDELVDALDDPCDIDFRGLAHAFAIKDIKDGTTVVLFGLGHGCEAARGNYTEFEVEVPAHAGVIPWLEAAKAGGTYARALRRGGGV